VCTGYIINYMQNSKPSIYDDRGQTLAAANVMTSIGNLFKPLGLIATPENPEVFGTYLVIQLFTSFVPVVLEWALVYAPPQDPNSIPNLIKRTSVSPRTALGLLPTFGKNRADSTGSRSQQSGSTLRLAFNLTASSTGVARKNAGHVLSNASVTRHPCFCMCSTCIKLHY